jgi:Flp pilus assembly protein TadD
MIERSWAKFLLDELEEYQEAIAFVTNHLVHHPNNHHALNNRALLFWEIGSIEEARRDFDAAAAVGGADPLILRNRGLFREQCGDLQGAIADFRTATTLAPHEAASWRRLGFAREKTGQLPEAMEALNRAITLEPQFAHTVEYRDTLARLADLPVRSAGSPATRLLTRVRSWWSR